MTLLAACSYRAAPPEKRRPAPRYEPAAPGSTRIQRPSYYTVKRGDTLYAIAWRYGLDYRDLARWNRVKAPFVIHPQQPLRLYPPRVVATQAQTLAQTSSTAAVTTPQRRPQESAASQPTVAARTTSSSSAAARPPAKPQAKTQAKSQTSAAAAPKPKPAAASGPVSWRWPLEGKVLAEFSSAAPNLQGLDIAAAPGTVVRAAAAGEVVYSGNGLVGYGELIIIKHSDRYLSAYAHNRQRFVKEGQGVGAGEKIAEVGGNGDQRSRLHFQIRENGKPVDPRKHLPRR